MRVLIVLTAGLLASPAASQDLKVLLCTAVSQLNLNSDPLEEAPSDDNYMWEMRYEEGQLISITAPFDCIEGTEDWTIGPTTISGECKQGIQDMAVLRISAEIDRYTRRFTVSAFSENSNDPLEATAWVQEGRCEFSRRKF